MDGKVFNLTIYKELKRLEKIEDDYRKKINLMDMIQLLDEVVKFQSHRQETGGNQTLAMMIIGRTLYREISKKATTVEMRILSNSYLKYVEFEIESFINKLKS